MIACFSDRVTDFLCKRRIIKQEEKDIYVYGFQLVISTLIGWSIVALIALITGAVFEMLTFYFIFASLREFCGGYHADTYLKCNMTFCGIAIGTLFISQFCVEKCNMYYWLILLPISVVYIILKAPIENVNKILEDEVKKYNRTGSIILAILYSIISVAFLEVYPVLSAIIAFTAFFVVVLMVAAGKEGEEGE